MLKIIEPIWQIKTVTASRLRGRIESVLDYTTASGFRVGDNPARALLTALPKAGRTHKVEHHAALAWPDVPGFMAELRAEDSTTARCLEFMILSAARPSEATGMTWQEVDPKARTWTVPAGRRMALTMFPFALHSIS